LNEKDIYKTCITKQFRELLIYKTENKTVERMVRILPRKGIRNVNRSISATQ